MYNENKRDSLLSDEQKKSKNLLNLVRSRDDSEDTKLSARSINPETALVQARLSPRQQVDFSNTQKVSKNELNDQNKESIELIL